MPVCCPSYTDNASARALLDTAPISAVDREKRAHGAVERCCSCESFAWPSSRGCVRVQGARSSAPVCGAAVLRRSGTAIVNVVPVPGP